MVDEPEIRAVRSGLTVQNLPNITFPTEPTLASDGSNYRVYQHDNNKYQMCVRASNQVRERLEAEYPEDMAALKTTEGVYPHDLTCVAAIVKLKARFEDPAATREAADLLHQEIGNLPYIPTAKGPGVFFTQLMDKKRRLDIFKVRRILYADLINTATSILWKLGYKKTNLRSIHTDWDKKVLAGGW